jgi:hypothetical protein
MIASDYASAGLALVPIPAGQKGPVKVGWNQRERVITDPERADRLTGNVGLAHAYCAPRPTMALDIDDFDQAEAWLAARGINLRSHLSAPDAVQIVSGKSGRAKLLYRLPPEISPPATIAVKHFPEVSPRTILEFRCATADGLTVQDVLPPSIHPETGEPYHWGGLGHWTSIPILPPEMLAVWMQEAARQNRRGGLSQGKASTYTGVDDTPRMRARVEELLTHISADCIYERYRDTVWAILSLGWDDAEVIAREWCETAPHRFEEPNFLNLVRDHDPGRTQTIGTLYHHAREEGWDG